MPEIFFGPDETKFHGVLALSGGSGSPGVVVCHPHPQFGGSMDNNVVYGVERAAIEAGFSTLRFNFRGVGRSMGRFDNGIGEREDVRRAVDRLAEEDGIGGIIVVGYSFGAVAGLPAAIEHPKVVAMAGISPPTVMADFSYLADCEKPKLVIVFTNTKHAARRIAQRLKHSGINCKEIHGDLDQRRRERVMKSFRNAHIQVLVATDLASRGLDVMEVSHIVNYDVPEDAAAYVHRVGRTARMGQSGYAVTFVTPEQGKLLTEIEKLINKELNQHHASWVIRRARPEPAKDDEAAKENGSRTPARFSEALQRDADLDAAGLKPVPRTLGSRFRTKRRSRR